MNAIVSGYDQKIGQTNFQDFLTKLLSEIPQILYDCQKILFLKHKKQDYLASVGLQNIKLKFKQSHFQKKDLLQEYNHRATSSSNIFKRFRFRLVEALMPFKQKSQASKEFLFLLGVIIRDIEKSLYKLQQQQLSFIDFLDEIDKIFLKFFQDFSLRTDEKEIPQKISENMIEIPQKIKYQSNYSDKSMKTEPQYHTKLRKIIIDVNQRFKTYSCLNLDYNYFRSSFFEGKNSQRCLFDEYLERNKVAKIQRAQYSKSFKEYLKKRQKRKLIKRNSLMESSNNERRRQNSISKSFRLNNKKPISRGNLNISAAKGQAKSKKQESFEGKIKKFSINNNSEKLINIDEDKSCRKGEYQMKNILITSKNLQFFSVNEMTQTTMKTTIRQMQMNKRRAMRLNEKGLMHNVGDFMGKGKRFQ